MNNQHETEIEQTVDLRAHPTVWYYDRVAEHVQSVLIRDEMTLGSGVTKEVGAVAKQFLNVIDRDGDQIISIPCYTSSDLFTMQQQASGMYVDRLGNKQKNLHSNIHFNCDICRTDVSENLDTVVNKICCYADIKFGTSWHLFCTHPHSRAVAILTDKGYVRVPLGQVSTFVRSISGDSK